MEIHPSLYAFYNNNAFFFQLQTAIEKIHSLGGGDAEIKQSTLKMIEENLVWIVMEEGKSEADT